MGQKTVFMRTFKQDPCLASLIFTFFRGRWAGTWLSQLLRISVVPMKIKEYLPYKDSSLIYSWFLLSWKNICSYVISQICVLLCQAYVVHSYFWCVLLCSILRYRKKHQQPRKRSQHCTYIEANHLVRFGKNTKMVIRTFYRNKKLKKLLKKSQNIWLLGYFPTLPDAQDT